MAPTDLSAIELPDKCREWVAVADPQQLIDRHAITVNLGWWNDSLRSRGLPGGPVIGTNKSGTEVDVGRAKITRRDVFRLADSVENSPEDWLRLLWHTLAWGAGGHVRLIHKRMDAVALDWSRTAAQLGVAAALSRTDPGQAFDVLYPGNASLVPYLGPSFFTKFLYFVGAGAVEHPCLILDDRVAGSLNRAGWESLSTRGPWPSDTYARYCGLLTRWATTVGSSGVRPDLIERWLFDEGGAGR
ncbi:hypothetical protein ACFWUP_21805 [Nocardia sp. NPDC058658]|uniref:8-oxoguanine DNA glycosylase OGG fold protein n=1 Tax=Nocardia sp. NPDC058658 TaxID=3346580 RepID=UPI003650DA99